MAPVAVGAELDPLLADGADVCRSLSDRRGALIQLDVDYVNAVDPAEAYRDPAGVLPAPGARLSRRARRLCRCRRGASRTHDGPWLSLHRTRGARVPPASGADVDRADRPRIARPLRGGGLRAARGLHGRGACGRGAAGRVSRARRDELREGRGAGDAGRRPAAGPRALHLPRPERVRRSGVLAPRALRVLVASEGRRNAPRRGAAVRDRDSPRRAVPSRAAGHPLRSRRRRAPRRRREQPGSRTYGGSALGALVRRQRAGMVPSRLRRGALDGTAAPPRTCTRASRPRTFRCA